MEYRVRKRDVSGAVRLPRTLEEALPNALVRRFLLRAGFSSSSSRAADAVRRHLHDFFRRLVGCMVVMMQHDGRRSFRLVDVQRACEHFGIRMYGYDDLCLLSGRAMEAYHVTELVECDSLFSRPVEASEEPDTEPGARFKKTDFVRNYSTWKEDADEQVSDLSEWEFSDSETQSENDLDGEMTSQETVEKTDRFVESLKKAQELVDDTLLDQEPDGEGDSEAMPGQGYYSDYDDSYEPSYVANQHASEEDEDAKWNTDGELHVLERVEESDPAELLDFNDSPNQYVISRQDFLRVFRALLSIALRMGELPISSVALSALHNATEQCLHRSLTEGSLHYQLVVILREQEHLNSQNQLEEELHVQREKVNELCQTIADNKAAFKAKELAMQQQIAKLKKQLQSQQDVQMQTPLSLKKSSKRKISSKKPSVRKGLSKSSNGSTSVVGALRSQGPNSTGMKKLRANFA